MLVHIYTYNFINVVLFKIREMNTYQELSLYGYIWFALKNCDKDCLKIYEGCFISGQYLMMAVLTVFSSEINSHIFN